MIGTKRYITDNSNGYDVLYEIGEAIKVTNIKGRTTEGIITKIVDDHFYIEAKGEDRTLQYAFTYDFVKEIKPLDKWRA